MSHLIRSNQMFVMSFSKLHRAVYGVKSQAGADQVRGLVTQATSIPGPGWMGASALEA